MDGGKIREETEKSTEAQYGNNEKKVCGCLSNCKCADCKCHLIE